MPNVNISSGFPIEWQIIRKTSDETVNNSTTLQNDDILFWSVGANDVWVFTLYIRGDSSAIADLKVGWSVPASTVMSWKDVNTAEAAAELTAASTDVFDGQGAGTAFTAVIQGVMVVSTTAGTAQLQWAQNTAEASNTKLLTNSYLLLYRDTT